MKNTFFTLTFLFSFFLNAQIKETSKNFQDNLNIEYAKKESSPLTDEDFKSFKTLDFFEINPKLILNAIFVKSKNEKVFDMKTSTKRLAKHIKYGVIIFQLNGKKHKLYLYQSADFKSNVGYEDYLFLPFFDLTNGNQSYVGGRYIDLRIPKGNTIEIDFNKAYNPYCAYSQRYSCPIVPAENTLKIEILAGVKKFHD